MRTIQLFLIICAIVFGQNCSLFKKENEGPEKYGKLNIVWRTPLAKDGLSGSEAPAIYDNKVIFSNYSSFEPEPYFALNADDGKTEYWKWEDYISSSANGISGKTLPVTFENILCLPLANGAIGINMDNGKTLWKNPFSSPGYHSVWGNYLFKQEDNSNGTAHEGLIKMIDIKTGNDRVVFRIDTISTPFFSFSGVLPMVSNTGDTLLYFSFNELFQQSDGSLNSYSRLYAFNLSQNTIAWSKEGISTAWPPIAANNKIYILGKDVLICLDAFSGSVLWEKSTHDKSGGFFKLFGDKLVVVDQAGSSFIHAYNISDGSPAWKIAFNGNTSEPILHKGIMYFTCGSDGFLWAINVSTGDVIWRERCPDQDENDLSFWSFGVNVDPVRNKLYVASFTGAFCLEPAQ
jgi:outer membrane protein assembly factor BamB